MFLPDRLVGNRQDENRINLFLGIAADAAADLVCYATSIGRARASDLKDAESAGEDISAVDAQKLIDFRVDDPLPAPEPRVGLGGEERL